MIDVEVTFSSFLCVLSGVMFKLSDFHHCFLL